MKVVCIGGAFVRRKGRKMRYGRRKLFFLCTLCLLIQGAGCTGKAGLYDSAHEEPASEEGAQSMEAGASQDSEQESQNPEELRNTEEPEGAEEEELLCVYVCGEVVSPGVYELPAGARIHDALSAAGGMTEEAEPSWLNLAEHAEDGQKIEVPSKEQAGIWKEAGITPESDEGASPGRMKEDTPVNLNTASEQELQTLPGIGEGKAKEIVNYRKEHGRFGRIEDLMQIPGIKEGVFSKIRDQITV